MKFHEYLRAVREGIPFTQSELAFLIGKSRAYMSRFEAEEEEERRVPPDETIMLLSKHLKLDLEELMIRKYVDDPKVSFVIKRILKAHLAEIHGWIQHEPEPEEGYSGEEDIV